MNYVKSGLCLVQDVSTRIIFGAEASSQKESLHDVVEEKMKNEKVEMSIFKGNVLCVVNVASQ